MSGETWALAILAALVLAGALGVVTTRNVAHAALYLLLSLASVAGVFVLLLAEFLALVQVLIYGGAIVIVLLFALMLTRLEDFSLAQDNPQRAVAALAALGVLGTLAAAVLSQRPATQPLQAMTMAELGGEVFTRWVVPFEIASLVLLVALVGAVVLTRAAGGPPASGEGEGE